MAVNFKTVPAIMQVRVRSIVGRAPASTESDNVIEWGSTAPDCQPVRSQSDFRGEKERYDQRQARIVICVLLAVSPADPAR
jgi:hypothetical protein